MFSTARIVAFATVLAVCSAAIAGCNPPTTPTPAGMAPKAFTRSVVVRGTVTDMASVGLDGVEIFVTGGDGGIRTTTTNSAGDFSVDVTVTGTTVVAAVVGVTATRTGYSGVTRSFVVAATGSNTVTALFTLIPLGGTLELGGTISGWVSTANGSCWIGEPYESDYSRSCTYFSLRPAVGSDARVELRWSGTAELQLWALDDSAIMAGTRGAEPTTVSLVVPRSRAVLLIVGPLFPTFAPASPLGFTLSATPTSTTAER